MKIRIGTRQSKLALAQTKLAVNAIQNAFPDAEPELVTIVTKGDRVLDRPLARIGGKGVFIAEIERALLRSEIDAAVHSAKDLPGELAEETCIPAVLPRAAVHDVLVTRRGFSADAVRHIGTSSKRRESAAAALFPQAACSDIRGNVDTRLQKLADGQYDGIILAAAGLERLGLFADVRFDFHPLRPQICVPAACQGIIAVQTRCDAAAELLHQISDVQTMYCFETERYVLQLLGAGCSAPVGAFAEISGSEICLTVTADQRRILTDTAPIPERMQLAERLVNAL